MTTPAPTPAIAIILGRGGSKGLPRKNLLPIVGRPCVEWTIRHAHASKRVGLVTLSSDDAEMRHLATTLGVLALDRPPHLASDTARVDDAARHAHTEILNNAPLRERHPWLGDSAPVVILYANVPIRPADATDRALDTLTSTRCDSVQSYQPVGKHHPWWTARVDPDTASVRPWEGEILNHNIFRRQDLPPAFIPDGGVIALTPDALHLRIPNVADGPHAFFGRDRRGIINPEGSVVDIDTRIDLLVAEAMLKGAT
ncbi:MAG: acylneuraminate cytidylyltransferase family protein [Phycisphaerales bacterium]|nr:MAG: acylneuraminate cytidylyltransferase family protein [Phycisphaerales bacterium]